MAQHLAGKVAVITGGAGGIGTQISKVFAEQGAKVIVADTGADVEGRMGVDPTRVNAVVDEIRKAGGEAISAIGDVSEMDVAEGIVRQAIDTYGKLDIVVAAHGILRERMIFNMTEDDWDGVVKAHLKGCFTMTKFASIHWRAERNGGRMIYFTSTAGIFGSAGQPNYAAAHMGKIGLMRSTAQALGRYGVTTNCIAPGASTRMTDRGRNAVAGASESAAGTSRDPKAVVPVIVYLASDQGANINGRVFGASGHKITLYKEPTLERVLFNDEPLFNVDELFEEWPNSLGVGGYEMERQPGQPAQPTQ